MIDYILSIIESIGIKLQNWSWQKRWGKPKGFGRIHYKNK
jgi:hypothetical protein